ncbi:ABC transporter [Streptomyces sp. NPDC001530]|uniref:ABC transporter n=1 Tax=Streptomyces sp. NPDC001530 TaxID=3364582 RepID=UPI00367C7493
MTALLRYQAALLLRSQRWLSPCILYAAFLAIGVQSGQPVLDSLGYSAAAVLIGAAATLVVTVISDPTSTDHQKRMPVLAAGAAGLLAALVCALLGTAVGALTTWPLLRSPGRAVPAMLLAALLALVLTGSPAHVALTDLITGSQEGRVPAPLLPLAAAAGGALRSPLVSPSRRCAVPPATRRRGTA